LTIAKDCTIIISLSVGILALALITLSLFLLAPKNKQMVYASGRLFVSTGEDVSEMVAREAENSEYDSPYIGVIESTVNKSEKPGAECPSNFGNVGSKIIFNGDGVAVELDGKWIQFDPQDR